jgi:GntR family histidine utilization transcriptional repressor
MDSQSKAIGLGFRDVRDTVLERIKSGSWSRGTLIPSEKDLAVEFNVARATVSRALLELAAKGYLDRRRKGGTRVKSRPDRSAHIAIPLIREEIESAGAAYGFQLLSRKTEPCPAVVSQHLAVPKSTKLLHLQCLHFADATPFQFEDRWINTSTLPDALETDFAEIGPNEWLVARVPFTEVNMKIGAVIPPLAIAQALQQEKSEPNLCVQRTTWLDDQSVTHVRLYFATGYQLQTTY